MDKHTSHQTLVLQSLATPVYRILSTRKCSTSDHLLTGSFQEREEVDLGVVITMVRYTHLNTQSLYPPIVMDHQ